MNGAGAFLATPALKTLFRVAGKNARFEKDVWRAGEDSNPRPLDS